MEVIPPDHADDLETGCPDRVLTLLLAIDDIRSGLAGPEELLVLHPAVELDDRAVRSDQEVGSSDHLAVRPDDRGLQLWPRQPELTELYARDRFADALRPSIGEGEDLTDAACARSAGNRCADAVEANRTRQPSAECFIGHRDGQADLASTRHVEESPINTRRPDPTDADDVLIGQLRSMGDHVRRCSPSRAARPCRMWAITLQLPGGEPVQAGSARMADDRTRPELIGNRRDTEHHLIVDRQRSPRRGRQIRPASNSCEFVRGGQPLDLTVRQLAPEFGVRCPSRKRPFCEHPAAGPAAGRDADGLWTNRRSAGLWTAGADGPSWQCHRVTS